MMEAIGGATFQAEPEATAVSRLRAASILFALVAALPSCGEAGEHQSEEQVGDLGAAWTQWEVVRTIWVSEEAGRNVGLCNRPNAEVWSVTCRGSYCDDIELGCMPVGADGRTFAGYDTETTGYWTPYISEEAPNNSTVCRDSNGKLGLVDGIRATGRYADNISLHCATMRPPPSAPPIHCGWSSYFSEESGGFSLIHENHLVGIRCRGRYCDDISLGMCSDVPGHTFAYPW